MVLQIGKGRAASRTLQVDLESGGCRGLNFVRTIHSELGRGPLRERPRPSSCCSLSGAAFAAAGRHAISRRAPSLDADAKAAGAQAGRPATLLPEEGAGKVGGPHLHQGGVVAVKQPNLASLRLSRSCRSRITFVGIIDGDAAVAERWIREHDTPPCSRRPRPETHSIVAC